MSISRKKFLKMSALIASASFLSFNGASCFYKDSITNPQMESFEDRLNVFLSEHPKQAVISTEIEGKQWFVVPTSAIHSTKSHKIIYRIKQIDSKMMIQGVHVIVLKKEGNNAFVNNLAAGDIILTSPRASLSDIARKDNSIMKGRFLEKNILK